MSYREKTSEEYDAINKNLDLICDLSERRDNFASIGTNKAKRRLNKLSDKIPLALAIRMSLEIEDKNICAKKYFGEWRDKIYQEKSDLISGLISLSHKNNWIYGIQRSDVINTTHVIYFEFPGCEQISWHYSPQNSSSLPKYSKKWDGKINSTLNKLEKVVVELLKQNNLITEKDFKTN